MPVPEQAFCGECGAPLERGIKFCGNCGAVVAAAPVPQAPPAPVGARADRFCPECGATTKPNQRYCRICGTNLPSGSVQA